MADNTIELTRRRVLGALGTIGVTSAVAGAGTMAAFSDEEQSTDNSIGAGTLNLTTGSSSDGSSFNISVSNLAPGEEAEVGYLDLKNSGSIDGYLDYEITGWTEYENGRNDAEIDAGDTSGGDPGPGAGELGDFLEFRAFVDRTPGNGDRNNGTAITSGYVGLSTGIVQTTVPVAAGETIRIWIDARIPSSVGDRIQSDSAEVDAAFHLNQNQ